MNAESAKDAEDAEDARRPDIADASSNPTLSS